MALNLITLAQREVDDTMARLPRHLRTAAKEVAIRVEGFPEAESGLEEDLLGVFLGNTHAEWQSGQVDAMPTEIVLFVENIWDYAEGDAEVFREEVRITLLHELGHFLGLDEIDLEERGLD